MEELIDQVKTKIDTKEKEKEALKQKVTFGTILMTHADGTDKMLIALGFGMAAVNGLGLPSFTFLAGNIINAFAETDTMLDSVRRVAL